MSLPAKILALLLALAASFAAGWGKATREAHRDAQIKQLAQERAARVLEAQESRRAAENADALTNDRLRTERAAAGTAQRLRDLASTAPGAAASCPGRNDDPSPAAWRISDRTREDLVQLASSADAVADRLRACQRELSGRLTPESEAP
ncbi:hypothetical protein [Roseateles depolymerans]|uniref:Uncharacterized protein n=1 Tax=Roseateles depolymerans TaxID=76731 RepID=A0A0U3MR13_9BURK|nr:hypothetical protein [Roseateles depolymerans]ALV06714.1 hypothetical protein RD2015_2242 [Roseateles depolymerans]REG19691.1 hypothetical protein DES44_2191 [Roseateles depolymerans]